MTPLLRSLGGRSLVLLLLIPLLLAACGGSSSGGGGTTSGTPSNSSITVTVGGKLDTEAQLLTEMYSLLLKKAGFHVVEKRALGTNAVVFAAITSGTYGVCTTQSKASSLGAMKISDLVSKASSLTIATPPDGKQYGVEVLKSAYGITFKGVTTYNEEGLTFPAVMKGAQDLNICYTTAALIAKDNFILLQDDKNAFPAYNPAPIVRDSTLQKAPGIATALNPLAPKLTTQVSQQLQAKVVDGQSVTQVATDFLKSQGLL